MKRILLVFIILSLLIGCIAPVEQIEPEQEIEKALEETSEESKYVQIDTPEQEKEGQKEYLKEFLEQVPDKYWYFDINDELGGIVVGDNKMDAWRFVGNHIEPGLYYWDYPNSKDVYIFFDEVNMYQLHELRDLEGEKPKISEYRLGFVKQSFSNYEYTWSPVDWMKEYADSIPSKVDTSPQGIKINDMMFTSELGLHFEDDDGVVTTFRFDNKYNVPVFIEKRKGTQVMEQHRYFFDVRMFDWQNWAINAEITEEIANIPENSVILTLEEAEKLNDKKSNNIKKRISIKNLVIDVMEGFEKRDWQTGQRSSI